MPHRWDSQTAFNIALWLNGNYDEETKKAVSQLIKKNPIEAQDAFYTNLGFGTGGIRGLVGVGTNRINLYTIRITTQSLANYINKQTMPLQGHSVFIGFDSRHHSLTFAHEAAKVLAANGIKVFLCQDFRPTPLISFGCRLKECTAAIMITASHNPAEYNGFKIYWSDGGQILPCHSVRILKELKKITNINLIKMTSSIKDPLISLISDEIDEIYIKEGFKLQNYPKDNQKHGKDLKIIYTSLHGTGITLTPRMLQEWGFNNISYVHEQIIADGNFPTVKSPNPENESTLAMGLKILLQHHGDILIANDPDADRVGIGVLDNEKAIMLSGNQVACLCLEHICKALKNQNTISAAFIKTLVTTELFQAICQHYNVECVNVPPGFKYAAEIISERAKNPKSSQVIFGAEESCGYLYGTLTRDKDGVIPSALIAEIALQAKLEGKTLIDRLHELYRKYGVFVEEIISLNFEEAKTGKEKMAKKMAGFRYHIPLQLNGIDVVVFEDLLISVKKNLKTNEKKKICHPQSDLILLWLADGSKLMIRPSGTEPKIKLYCGVVNSTFNFIEACIKESKTHAKQLLNSLKSYLLND